ncbi:MAG: CBS domain-containing protein [Methanoculleaceae archaeon]
MTDPIVRNYMTTDVVKVEIPGNRDDVLRILKRTGISGVPVLKDGGLVGIITRKDLLRHPDETQLGLLMTPDPISIGPDQPLSHAAELLVRNNIRRLPVVEDGQLIGIISIADLIHAIAQQRIHDEIKGYVDATHALWDETPLSLVGRIMEISGDDALPILSADGTLCGIISERDLIRCSSIEDGIEESDFSNGTDDDEWTWESIRDLHRMSYSISRVQLPATPVKASMIRNVISVPLNAEVSECALLMKRNRLDQLPVISQSRHLVGMLFDRHLIHVLLPEEAGEKPDQGTAEMRGAGIIR